MKKKFHKILVVAALCSIATAVNAQSNLTWPQKKHLVNTKLGAALKDSLNLDEAKVAKVQNVNSKYQGLFAEVNRDNSLSPEQKKGKYGEVYRAKREELKKEISVEQIIRMEAIETRLKKEIGL